MSKYEYVDSCRTDPAETNPVYKTCAWLVVSTWGFYHWLARPQSATAARREALTVRVKHFFFDVTTEADAQAAADMLDLVERDFTADRPGVKFVGDITYIHTWAGFIYLATLFDCYSKKVVGWSIADHMRTELVADALKNAAATTVIEPLAIFHSDRGSVYTSADYRKLIKAHGMRSSMGRTGVCWDGRIVLLKPEERMRLPDRLRHEGPGKARRDRLHRRVLPPAFSGVSNVSCDVALSGDLVVRASLLWGCGARGESFVSGWHRPAQRPATVSSRPARSKDRHVHHTSRARRSSMQALDLHNRKTG